MTTKLQHIVLNVIDRAAKAKASMGILATISQDLYYELGLVVNPACPDYVLTVYRTEGVHRSPKQIQDTFNLRDTLVAFMLCMTTKELVEAGILSKRSAPKMKAQVRCKCCGQTLQN